jgi:tetratricopeptide (TPR) repeat protein/transcriptional regulator with XRE-family HTH domain
MSAFAGELKRLRKLRLLTQRELSEAAKVPVTTISELERGISQRPHPATVRKLAQALGLTGAELAGFHAAARAASLDRSEKPPAGSASELAAQAAEIRTEGDRAAASVVLGAGVAAATRTLPRDTGSFIGREQLLAELLSTAGSDAQTRICVVDGMAGVGKTTFAVHAAHQLAERFPDGQIFLELRGHVLGQAPADPVDALASLLQTVGIDARQIPLGTQERARLWRDRLAGKRLLLLLDDAANSEQVRPLLPGTAECLVLVTSRARLTALEDVQVISLGILPPDEAAVLFVRLASRHDLAPGDLAVGEIVRLCGYLPLAVGILAARLRHHKAWTPAWLAADLAAAHSRTKLMHAENQSVSAAFTLSYKDLATDERQLFRRLGIYPGADIDIYAASVLNGADLAVTRRHLDALYDHYLISEPVPGRFRAHDLLREHARDLAETDQPADSQAAIGRLLNYFLRSARAADRLLSRRALQVAQEDDIFPEVPPMATRQDATDWMEAERLNLHAAALTALSGSPAHATAISTAMHSFLCTKGYWDQARTLGQTALEAARRISDRRAHAAALANLAIVNRLTADFSAAIASGQSALRIYRALGDQVGEASALINLGWAQYLTYDFAAAYENLSHALTLYRTLGDQGGEATALTHRGYVSYITSDLPGAVSSLSRARELSHAVGDQVGEADALCYLGMVQYQTGPYLESTVTFTRALEVFRSSGIQNDEAWTLNYLGCAQILSGMLVPATANLDLALKMFRTLGNQYGAANTLNYLGAALRLTGDYRAATASQEESLKLFRAQGNQLGEANALKEIGILQQLTGDIQAAAASHARALELCQGVNDHGGEAECHNKIGDLLLASDPIRARDSYERALLICRGITAPLEEARALEGLGRCDLRDGQPSQATDRLRQALSIYRRLGSPDSRRVEGLLRSRHR